MYVKKTKLRICIYICLTKLGYNLGVKLTLYVYIGLVCKNNLVGSPEVHSGGELINMILLLLLGLKFNGKDQVFHLDRKPVQRDKTSVP